MAQAHHLLGRDEAVGYHTHHGGHKQRYDALNGVEPEYIVAKTY